MVLCIHIIIFFLYKQWKQSNNIILLLTIKYYNNTIEL